MGIGVVLQHGVPRVGAVRLIHGLVGNLCMGFIRGMESFDFKSMHVHEIEEWQQKGYVVLDVRTVPEFDDFHINGALNIPLNQLAARVVEIGNLNTPVLVHCAHGVRSFRAAAFLKVQGFENVIDAGGLE